MAKVDYSLRIANILQPVRYDDIPAQHDPTEKFVNQSDVMADGFFRGLMAIRHVTSALTELGTGAWQDLITAAGTAGYYELLAILDAAATLSRDLDEADGRTSAQQLLPFLSYRDEDVKRRAVQALTQIGDPSVLPQIEPFCHAEGLLKSAALYAFAVLSPDQHSRLAYLEQTLADNSDKALRDLLAGPEQDIPWDELYLLLNSPNPLVRETLQRVITRVRRIPKQITLQLLSDAHPPVRIAAIRTLRKVADDTDLEAMFEALQDPEKQVARTAQRWLERRNADIQERLPALLDSSQSLTRQVALELLETPLSGPVLEKVGALLFTRSTIDMRRAAIRKLKPHASEPAARQSLLRALNDNTADVCKSALGALRAGASNEDLPVLAAFLAEPRKHGAGLLPMIELLQATGTSAAIEVLREQLSHPSRGVRRAAFSALGELYVFDAIDEMRAVTIEDGAGRKEKAILAYFDRVEAVRAQLLESLNEKSTNTLISAVHARNTKKRLQGLTQIKSLERPELCRPLVEQMIFDTNANVRTSAVTFLQEHRDDQFVERLCNELKSYSVKELPAALDALASLGSHQVTDAVEPFLDHYDSNVTAHAAAALKSLGDDQTVADTAVVVLRQEALGVLNDAGLSDQEKHQAWSADFRGVRELLKELSTDAGIRACRILVENGWQPQTALEQAIVLLSRDDPDWDQFPEDAIPSLELLFTKRSEAQWSEVVTTLTQRWPRACKPLVKQGLTSSTQGIADRSAALAREQNLFTSDELEAWLRAEEGPELQTCAVRLLGWTGDEALVPRFLDMLDKAISADLGGLAASVLLALGDIGDERALPVAASMLEDPAVAGLAPYVLRTISGIDGNEATRLLVFALRRGTAKVATAAARLLTERDWQADDQADRARLAVHLRQFRQIESFDERALHVVADYAVSARDIPKELLDYFCAYDNPIAVAAVVHANWSYMLAAQEKKAAAYLKQNADVAITVLIEHLQATLEKFRPIKDKMRGPTGVAGRLLGWLTALQRSESTGVLMRVLQEDVPDLLQRPAAVALGKIGCREATPLVLALFERSSDNADKRALSEALMRLGDPAALPPLIAARKQASHAPLQKMLDKAITRLEKAS